MFLPNTRLDTEEGSHHCIDLLLSASSYQVYARRGINESLPQTWSEGEIIDKPP